MTTLIIARHGNTFGPGDTPTRVGARTDLPLVHKGREQAKAIGRWLKAHNLYPEVSYCSELTRTRETAEIALKELGYPQPVFPLAMFNEIDYGPDENKAEEDVIARIGAQAIKEWDERAIVPDGWQFEPTKTILDWQQFADHIVEDEQDIIFVATSNGIARFAPHITGDFDGFAKAHNIKIGTGCICVFEHRDGQWRVVHWNLKP